MGRLNGKIALVLGGSRGMGAALARELVDGARFIRLDITKAGENWEAAVKLTVTEFARSTCS